MTTIRQIPYAVDFYWKGDRWKQFIRAKDVKSKGYVVCYKFCDPCGPRVDMPLGRTVKPVIKLSDLR